MFQTTVSFLHKHKALLLAQVEHPRTFWTFWYNVSNTIWEHFELIRATNDGETIKKASCTLSNHVYFASIGGTTNVFNCHKQITCMTGEFSSNWICSPDPGLKIGKIKQNSCGQFQQLMEVDFTLGEPNHFVQSCIL